MKSETLTIDGRTWKRCPECKRYIGRGNQCRFCGKWYKSPRGLANHESVCFFNPQAWIDDNYADDELGRANDRWCNSEIMDFQPTSCPKTPWRTPVRGDCFGCPDCRTRFEFKMVRDGDDEFDYQTGSIVVTCEKVSSG